MPMNGILWETSHQGKLRGMRSISTDPNGNKNCRRRRRCKNAVCGHCYAGRYTAYRATLTKHLERNAAVLTARLLREIETPLINDRYYRFESFGDLRNGTQLQNYFLIAERNPETQFALWTKNLPILRKVLRQGITKPKNLRILYSSPRLNVQAKVPEDLRPYIDHVFTVYDKEWLREHTTTEINCGKAECLRCLNCYGQNGPYYINEELK